MADILHFPAQPEAPEPLSPPASPSSAAASDEAIRERALDTRASWIVEAPAGSGKTGLLMQRYLKLLADESVAQPDEVLAITFTRKATAELRARVLTELEAAHRNDPLPEPGNFFQQATRTLAEAALARDHALGWSLLADPQRLRIRTIDSLCAEIAAALPLLSGSGGARTPVEDAAPLYHLAARRTLLHLGGTDRSLNQALRTVLLHRDGNLSDCESLLAGMLAAREQWAELVPLDRSLLNDPALEAEVRAKLEKSLEAIVCAGLTRAVNAVAPHLLHELTQLAALLSGEPGYNDEPSPLAVCADHTQSPEAKAEHLDHWRALICLLLTEKDWRKPGGINKKNLRFILPPEHKPQLIALIDAIQTGPLLEMLHSIRSLPPARYPDDQWRVAKALFHLLLHALAELKVLFAERGECDFAELSLAARDILRADSGPADLASSAGLTLRHLLVDEMQDTSFSQYELIKLLTESWDGHSQTLFLVGDPKQSIYLFRQARVERFLRTMRERRLGDIPVEPLYLTSNFRSQAPLVNSFNRDFRRIFPSADDVPAGEAVDVPFVEASAVKPPTTGRGIRWHTAVLGEEAVANATGNAKHDHALAEARSIRTVIEQWQATPLPPGRKLGPDGRPEPWSIAVLARVRNHLAPILVELQRSGDGQKPIPFRAVKVETLAERAEILDAVALTRALLHSADRVAWLAVLHAPWCGLGLADLLALTGEGPNTDPFATIPNLIAANAEKLSDTGRTLLQRAWPTLQTALAEAGRDSLSVHVDRTWRSLGGDAALQPPQLANVQHFFRLLRELEQPGGWLDLAALKSQLEHLYAEPTGGEHDVALMTIHSAKGLEWDVVLVPALEKKGQSSRSELLNWLELDGSGDAEASVVLAPIHGKGAEPSDLYRWLNSVRNAREKAERKRLYYVACTRAREELHLFAACKRSATSGDLLVPPATLLSACWPAAEERFAAVAAAPAAAVASSAASSPATARNAFVDQLTQSLPDEETPSQDFAIAASASTPGPTPELAVTAATPSPPLLHRLPLAFDPLQRFAAAAATALPYPPASVLRHAPAFERPDGSFAVRAFGTVVHRFLQVLAANLATGKTPDSLLAELPSWQPRLLASLRAEGLPPTLCRSESTRALKALTSALTDPIGRWLLSPLPRAASERTLTFATPAASSLRVDRTFLAGAAPLAHGNSFLWIVDFKTTQQGGRSTEQFDQQERAKYTAQMESYATIRRSLPDGDQPIILALYYPLLPRLIHWPAPPAAESEPAAAAAAPSAP